MSDVALVEPAEILPALTSDESSFAMAIVEFGGNVGAAYKSVYGKDAQNPIKRGNELICRPEIALQIKKINDAIGENSLISLGSHLTVLAELRDKCIRAGEFKTALASEVKRGEVAGFYKDKTPQATTAPRVNINIGITTPGNAAEWGQQYGQAPVVIQG